MTKEQCFFLNIISDYVNARESPQCDNNIEWERVIMYARTHQLLPILYTQCKDYFPSTIANNLRLQYLRIIASSIQKKKVIDNLLPYFHSEGVEYFIVKGGIVSEYYHDWQYRTMGDVDIVVDNKEKTHRIMLQQNFHPIALSPYSEWQYKKNDCKIEIHDTLIYDNDQVTYDKAQAFFGKYREYVKNNTLDINYHVAYLFLHLRKHFMKFGVGFRQFLDIAIMTKNCNELDWGVISGYLYESDLYYFAKVVCGFNERWFGVTSPLEKVEMNDVFFYESTNYIFANGVFGFDNNDNKKQLQMIRSKKKRFPFFYMFKDALFKVFLPYSSMIEFDYCSFLVDKPVLLPIAWLKRIIYTIRKKGIKAGTNQISNSFVSKKYIAEREEMFSNWGLELKK